MEFLPTKQYREGVVVQGDWYRLPTLALIARDISTPSFRIDAIPLETGDV
jgi:hypothetical protein